MRYRFLTLGTEQVVKGVTFLSSPHNPAPPTL